MRSSPISTLAELRDAFDEAWSALSTAIDASASTWDERILESEDKDAAAWSPRLAVWHAVAGEEIRIAYVSRLLGTRPETPDDMMTFASSAEAGDASVEALRQKYRAALTPDDMRAVLTRTHGAAIKLLARLTDDDLRVRALLVPFVRQYLSERGQIPSDDLRGVLVHGVIHLCDHADQILGAHRG